MSQLILVAPAAFKGTLGPRRVADALAVGARRALPSAAVLQCPIADGGDGLLDAVLAPAALRERLSVTGPLGEPVSGELGWVDPETAIFESATACGIALLKPEQLDPLRATTRGVRELVWQAVERGAETVVVGLDGSARRGRPRHTAGGWCRGRSRRGSRVLRQGRAHQWSGLGAGAGGVRRGTRQGPARDHGGGDVRQDVARREGVGRGGAARPGSADAGRRRGGP